MSGYTIKHTGKAALRPIELLCEGCLYEEERSIDMRNDDEQVARDMLVECPNCDHGTMIQVIRTAPSLGGSDPKSDVNLGRMQRSLRERFMKKEVDDVRHKHGVNYDDSLRSAAATRIAKGEKPIE